jgi:SAM-dependent methyltransferase
VSQAGDTFERSMAHWSEAQRAGMDAFYAVATQDYRELALARDWRAWLEGRDRILDVACGSGKFPAALARHAGLDPAREKVLDLLDPSAFSLAEARRNLEAPFVGGRELEVTLQDLDPEAGPWDAVWATHALYALPEAELERGLRRFVDAVRPGGAGFIAHARRSSFYLSFYEAYLRARRGGAGTPYTSAEALLEGFARLGVKTEVEDISYVGRLPAEARAAAEGFLRRCLFDETVPLEEMEADPDMGRVLDAHRGADGSFRFPQQVAMIFVAPAG